jgi:choline transport protein
MAHRAGDIPDGHSVTLVNIYGFHLLDKISKGMLVWNIASFFIVIITLLDTQDN